MTRLLLLPLMIGTAWAAECEQPTSSSDLVAALASAESAFSQLDVAAFNDATDEAQRVLPCLEDPVTRHVAAELHRFLGLRAFLDRDASSSVIRFAAARTIEPKYTFPTSLVPDDNPVRDDYNAIDTATNELATLDPPAVGRIHLDGSEGLQRSTVFPTVVQIFDDSGGVTFSGYLEPGATFPDYDIRSEPAAGNAPVPVTSKPTFEQPPAKPFNTPMLIGGAAGVVAAGALYGTALASRSAYENKEEPTKAQLDGLRAQTNGLVIASGVVGVAGIAVGTTAFFTARW